MSADIDYIADILLVEDDAASRKLMRTVLCSRGYRLIETENLAEAHAALAHAVPRLVLLDLRLREGSGLELVRHIRADSRLAHLPVIAVTAQAMERDRERVLRAGADAYISKPVDTRRLPHVVADLIEQGRGANHAR